MILSYKGISPDISEGAYIIGQCTLAGRVRVSERVSIWPGAVVRAELAEISIGQECNVQDNVTLHTDEGYPIVLGRGVTVGHNAVLHGCQVGSNTVIGMGAVVLNGARIGENCIIGAGALVKSGMVVPPGSMVIGIPGVIKRSLTEAEIAGNEENCREYLLLAEGYKNN